LPVLDILLYILDITVFILDNVQ